MCRVGVVMNAVSDECLLEDHHLPRKTDAAEYVANIGQVLPPLRV